MEDYMPLLQTLVWPAFILLLVWATRKRILSILDAIRERIEAGDPFEAGRSGIKLGPSSETRADRDVLETQEDDAPPSEEGDLENPGIYLVHLARRDRSLDRGEFQYYRLQIFIETEPGVDLDCVSKVVYQLHPDFPKPARVVTDVETQFELQTAAWGQFYMTADVYLEGRDKPFHLERYINF